MGMETTREAARSEIRSRREVGQHGHHVVNGAVARETLNQDLGYHSDSVNHAYGLDDPTRDRLIAHARQDAAHAMLNGVTAYKAARAAMWIGLLNAALLIWVLVKLT
jgi:hypothetical protein